MKKITSNNYLINEKNDYSMKPNYNLNNINNSKKDKRNMQVYVLPPDILKKLGINILMTPENTNDTNQSSNITSSCINSEMNKNESTASCLMKVHDDSLNSSNDVYNLQFSARDKIESNNSILNGLLNCNEKTHVDYTDINEINNKSLLLENSKTEEFKSSNLQTAAIISSSLLLSPNQCDFLQLISNNSENQDILQDTHNSNTDILLNSPEKCLINSIKNKSELIHKNNVMKDNICDTIDSTIPMCSNNFKEAYIDNDLSSNNLIPLVDKNILCKNNNSNEEILKDQDAIFEKKCDSDKINIVEVSVNNSNELISNILPDQIKVESCNVLKNNSSTNKNNTKSLMPNKFSNDISHINISKNLTKTVYPVTDICKFSIIEKCDLDIISKNDGNFTELFSNDRNVLSSSRDNSLQCIDESMFNEKINLNNKDLAESVEKNFKDYENIVKITKYLKDVLNKRKNVDHKRKMEIDDIKENIEDSHILSEIKNEYIECFMVLESDEIHDNNDINNSNQSLLINSINNMKNCLSNENNDIYLSHNNENIFPKNELIHMEMIEQNTCLENSESVESFDSEIIHVVTKKYANKKHTNVLENDYPENLNIQDNFVDDESKTSSFNEKNIETVNCKNYMLHTCDDSVIMSMNNNSVSSNDLPLINDDDNSENLAYTRTDSIRSHSHSSGEAFVKNKFANEYFENINPFNVKNNDYNLTNTTFVKENITSSNISNFLDDTENSNHSEKSVIESFNGISKINKYNSINSIFIKKKRGRPSKKPQNDNNEIITDSTIKTNIFKLKKATKCTCGVCYETLDLRNWTLHNVKNHNMLAWKEGETPIDFTNEKLVISLLQIKAKSKKKFVCEKCLEKRVSAHGFLAHLKTCQKSQQEIEALKITCDVCGRSVLPQSFRIHMAAHKLNDVSISDESYLLGKRKAAERANESFKKFKLSTDECISFNERRKFAKRFYKCILQDENISSIQEQWEKEALLCDFIRCGNNECDYVASTIDKMNFHFKYLCQFRQSKIFFCNLCPYNINIKKEIENHIISNHNNNITDIINEFDSAEFNNTQSISECSDESDHSTNNYSVKKHTSSGGYKRLSFKFTETATKQNFNFHTNYGNEFILNNYSSQKLFDDIICNIYIPLNKIEANEFLPEIQQSCNMAQTMFSTDYNIEKTDLKWKKYDLFESDLNNGIITMWCGGCIWSLSWIPGDRNVQYLSIAANRNMEKEFYSDKSYIHNNIIQIWDIGELSNKNYHCLTSASMVFAFAHNHGVVWDMDWCPSGCDDDCKIDTTEKNDMRFFPNEQNEKEKYVRMGLLAIACSNGSSYIYAVCHSSALIPCESKIYQTSPSVVLNLQNKVKNENNEYQATKITWSKMKGHNIIAVGYSNGFVALFDLLLQSPLLKTKSQNSNYLLPYFKFQPYPSLINGLVIIPKNDQSPSDNIVLGISSPSGCGMWEKATPIINCKKRFTNVLLSYPWPQIMGLAEGLVVNGNSHSFLNGVHLISPRNNVSDTILLGSSILPGGGTGDTSLYSNAVLIAGVTGDVTLIPIRCPLINNHRSKKKYKRKRAILSFCNIIKLDQNVTNNENEKNVDDNIKDINSLDNKQNPLTYEELSTSYGLLFSDVSHMSTSNNMENHVFSECPVNRWPLRSLLSAKINTSKNAFWFLAVGGSAGQVRVFRSSHIVKNKNNNQHNSNEAYF